LANADCLKDGQEQRPAKDRKPGIRSKALDEGWAGGGAGKHYIQMLTQSLIILRDDVEVPSPGTGLMRRHETPN